MNMHSCITVTAIRAKVCKGSMSITDFLPEARHLSAQEVLDECTTLWGKPEQMQY